MFNFGLHTQVSDSGPHGPLVIKALVCKTKQLTILEMKVLLCLSLLVSKKNVSPMEIPRDFPGALSRQKHG